MTKQEIVRQTLKQLKAKGLLNEKAIKKHLKESSEIVSNDPRPIYKIAQEISKLWRPVNFAAKPYLEAMFSLDSINDDYGQDSAKSIILYFLGNASSFKGEDAKRIKIELKKLAGIK